MRLRSSLFVCCHTYLGYTWGIPMVVASSYAWWLSPLEEGTSTKVYNRTKQQVVLLMRGPILEKTDGWSPRIWGCFSCVRPQ